MTVEDTLQVYYKEVDHKHEAGIILLDLEKELMDTEIKLQDRKTEILLDTDWTTVIPNNKRPTKEIKEAYIYGETGYLENHIKHLKLKITACKMELQMCDVRIKYYRKLIDYKSNKWE